MQIKFQKTDKIIEWTNWLLLLATWLFVLLIYSRLPGSIPVHFNAAGDVDDFGSKRMIFLLPGLDAFVCVLFFFIKRNPHRLNYPAKITAENAAAHYRLSLITADVLELFILLLFSA